MKKKVDSDLSDLIERMKIPIIFIAISLIVGISLGCFWFKTDSYWQNYWTLESSFFTATLALLCVFLELNYHKKENSKEIKNEKQNKLNERFTTLNRDNSKAIIEIQSYLLSDQVSTQENKKVYIEKRMVQLLYQYQDFLNMYDDTNEDDANNQDEPNRLDPKNTTPQKLIDILKSDKFEPFCEDIKNDFGDLSNTIKRILSYESVESNKSNEYPYILGNWLISKGLASKIKYIVGFAMESKRIIAIIKIKEESENSFTETEFDNRIKFIPKETKTIYNYYDKNNECTKTYISQTVKILKKWKSRNPVLNYDKWDKPVEDKMCLRNLIKDLSQDNKNINEINDILIVKVREFAKRVTSDDIRYELSKKLTELVDGNKKKERINYADFKRYLEKKYPYLLDHSGVYQGVFNKLGTGENDITYLNYRLYKKNGGQRQEGDSSFYIEQIKSPKP